MTIVFAPAAYFPAIGGSETYTQGLAEALALHGVDTHVVVADIDTSEAFYELGHTRTGVGSGVMNGVDVHRVRLLPRTGTASRRNAPAELSRERRRFRRNFSRQVRRLYPDYVVTLPHLFPNVAESLRLRPKASWRLVYAPILHEEDQWWPTQQIRQAVQQADGLIALTEFERDRLVAGYGADSSRVAIIPPGVHLPDDVLEGVRDPVVLFLGRQTASKSIDLLIEAMAMVWRSLPEARLILAGPLAVPTTESSSSDLDPRIEIRGAVSDQERKRLLSSVRLLASASVIESFGITTLEAWAHRTPVVVADSPVTRGIVRDGADGLIAQRSADSMADAILRLLTDPAGAAAMGSAGRARAETEFTWDRAGGALRDHLASI